jgi:FKBP-type peptidyl-prolyl cis-trans isomerase FklB
MKALPVAFVVAALVVTAALSLAATEPAAPASTAQQAAQKPAELKLTTELDRLSYSLGVNVARSIRKSGMDLAPGPFLRGVSDALANSTPLMTEQEMGEALQHVRQAMAAKQQTMSAEAAETLARGQAFLAGNAKKEGVVVLPDGLQYKVLVPGDGPSPVQNDTVTVHYRGTLIDGTEFDSSYQRGLPAQFKVGEVIKGWQEALKLMKKGAKWQVFIPSDLAYGEAGRPPVIGPNEALVFTVELIDIKRGLRLDPLD